MAQTVELKKGNVKKKGVVGFSWTTFFFGFFVPLLRGDMMWAVGMFIAACVLPIISNIILAFIYNKKYTENLLQQGFEPCGEADRALLKAVGVYAE